MIPCTGTIKASDINVELGRNAGYAFKIGNSEERALAGKPSGLIKFSDFACKSVGFDMGVGYMSGFSEVYIGFQHMGGLGRADIGSIKGQYPSPYFPVNSIGNNNVGFYFHALCCSGTGHSDYFFIACNQNSPNGYLTNPVKPWGSDAVVTLTDAAGSKLVMQMYSPNNFTYRSSSPSNGEISAWLLSRRDTTIKVGITSK